VSAELKQQILELLKKDVEFRYAVAGLIGLEEILRRLDRHEEELKKLREDLNKLREDFNKAFEAFEKRFQALEKRVEGVESRVEALEKRVESVESRLESVEKRLDGVERRLEGVEKRLESVERGLEGVEKGLSVLDVRLTRVERTLEKLTLDIEEEARSIIKHRLRLELGLEIEISSLTLPDLELNIYGVKGDVCVVGEASVRASMRTLEELLKKLEIMKSKYPDLLRPKTIPVIYTSLAMPELVEEAKKRGVWVLKATGDYCKPDFAAL